MIKEDLKTKTTEQIKDKLAELHFSIVEPVVVTAEENSVEDDKPKKKKAQI